MKQTAFYNYLLNKNLSENTIKAYMASANQYFERYTKITKQNLNQYRAFLISNFKPQTVNLRIQGINNYLEYSHKKNIFYLTYTVICSCNSSTFSGGRPVISEISDIGYFFLSIFVAVSNAFFCAPICSPSWRASYLIS